MLVVGRRLVHAFEGKNEAEAELRHSATRLRENALQKDNVEDRKALQVSLGQVTASESHCVKKTGDVASEVRQRL